MNWLLEGEPWIAYRTRRDLLAQPEEDPDVRAAREGLLSDTRVRELIAELAGWPGRVIASHKSAGQPFHKLAFLADLGLTKDDDGMGAILARILASQSPEGPFSLPITISKGHGGTGEEQPGWALCDAPLVVYAMLKFGLGDDPAVKKAIDYLLGLVRDNGWPCVVSATMGSFRGPGRKDDPCPFATLAMLKALSAAGELRDSEACHIGAETLLTLWHDSMVKHPYMFYMGTDFRKLKVPFIWYDLLHVLEVLTRFPWLKGDDRLADMVAVMRSKADTEGCYTLESVWTAWSDWEFGQKKAPSRWLTLAAWRISGRCD